MACLCTEQYDDIKLKLDLIIELLNTWLGRLSVTVTVTTKGGGGGGIYISREAKDYVEGLKRRLDDELIELVLQAAVVSGILD